MRATVSSSDLDAALKLSVAANKTTMPVLQHALVTAGDGTLSVETSDCEIWVRSTMPAQVDEPGAALLLESLLRPIASGAGQIRLGGDGKDNRGRSNYVVPVMPADGFPQQDPANFRALTIDPMALRAAIRAVAYSGENDAPATYMRALYIVPGGAWCTDGKQIGRARIDYDGPLMALPVGQVPRVLAALQPGATLAVGNKRNNYGGALRIDAPPLQLTVRLMQSAPPDIERVIASATVREEYVVLKRAAVIAALRRFMPFAQWGGGKTYTNWTVSLEAAKGELTLADRNDDNRECLTDAATEIHGNFRFALDPKRLLDAVNAIDTDTFTLHPPGDAGTSPHAVVLLPAGAAVSDCVHLLAPIVI